MKICLDAGHFGRYNQSPADKRYYESVMVWKLHLLQKKYLEEYGIEVITTRGRQDEEKGLFARGAKSRGCDLFLSGHSNAVGTGVNDQIDYPAAYCAIDGSADGIGMALAQCVERTMETRQPARIEHRRGQNGDYYGVLRGAASVGTPGLILEHSFHTNAQIAAWLLNETNLERLAAAEAAAIALYYGITIQQKKSGWVEEEGGWRFYLGDTGWYVANDWYRDGDDWYWFDGAGMMVHDTWKTGFDGTWYYLETDGAMARDRWIIWKEELYRVLEDGRLFEGEMKVRTDEKGALKIVESTEKKEEGRKQKAVKEDEAEKETAERKGCRKRTKPNEAQNEAENRAQNKAENEAQNRPQNKTENRPQNKIENRPQKKAQSRPQNEAENRPQNKTENRPQNKIENRPQNKIENRP